MPPTLREPMQESRRRKPRFFRNRKIWKFDGLLNIDWREAGSTDISEETTDFAEARLVSSETLDGKHLPVLDIDFDAALIASSTAGHFHLYLNKELTWEAYAKLLEALYEAGIIQEGYYKMAIARGKTFVRCPGVYKKPGEGGSGGDDEDPELLSSEDPF